MADTYRKKQIKEDYEKYKKIKTKYITHLNMLSMVSLLSILFALIYTEFVSTKDIPPLHLFIRTSTTHD